MFAQHIDCGFTFEPPRFGAKIKKKKKKIGTPPHTLVFLYKGGVF